MCVFIRLWKLYYITINLNHDLNMNLYSTKIYSSTKVCSWCLQLHQNYGTKQRELLPKTIVKRFPANKQKIKAPSNDAPKKDKYIPPRFNPFNIQMLSTGLYKQIFGNSKKTSTPTDMYRFQQEFSKHQINIKTNSAISDVNFELPKLQGNDLEEHFHIIGEEQAKPYRELVNRLLTNIPERPQEWLFEQGWIKYEPGKEPIKVEFPAEDCLVFDVEVCVKSGPLPVMATCVTENAWYGWVSQSLIDENTKPVGAHNFALSDLIPLESKDSDSGKQLMACFKKPRVVIGHNVSFDRARIKEQYWLERTGTRFIDTMSLHICVSGVTSYQRAVLKSGKFDEEDEKWKNCSSLNSLVEVYKLYCKKELDKEIRDIFVEGTLKDVKENFQILIKYCSGDVLATYDVLKELFPLFLQRFPHPVTLAGMLEMSTAYLPVNSNWIRYLSDSEQTYDDLENESKFLLSRRADNACHLMHDFKYREDLWMWDQDWSVQELKIKNNFRKVKSEVKININKVKQSDDEEEPDPLEEKFKYLMQSKDLLPIKRPLLPGYPAWYRKLCSKINSKPDWVPGPDTISTSMQITPKLLRLTWEGYPLHYIRGKGWGFLVPFSADIELANEIPLSQLVEKCPVVTYDRDNNSDGKYAMTTLWKDVQENLAKKEYYIKKKADKTDGKYVGTGVWCNTVLEDCCYFMKLPHKDGISHRVGNPLAKDFINKFSENVLAGDDINTEKILEIARMLSYWRNNRDRIMHQIVVWLNSNDLPDFVKRNNDFEYGAILPQVVVCGTLTRRAMEPTWMTASNAHIERIGSELRGMIQAPPGYNIVGADVDSQELWIAAVIGDAHATKMHGATPFGWMTLSGSKANETDMHSVTAKAVGISRDNAKVINYARIYGAGQNFAERLLKQFNPSISDSEAKNKAAKMFQMTKGKRVYQIKNEYTDDFVDRPYSGWEAMKIAKAHGKTVSEMFNTPKWVGGTESAMFNRLEEIARSSVPVTPFLQCQLSRALEPESMPDERFLPTRVNWVVQSGAVDYLHLMLVSMKWLMQNKARFVLSFHDEVRYLVREEHKYKTALAMHITNLLTRSFCASRLGLYDLPLSVAFFTSVEIDTILRKECNHDCRTPSNSHGFEKGYGIPHGESLNILKALEKAGNRFEIDYSD